MPRARSIRQEKNLSSTGVGSYAQASENHDGEDVAVVEEEELTPEIIVQEVGDNDTLDQLEEEIFGSEELPSRKIEDDQDYVVLDVDAEPVQETKKSSVPAIRGRGTLAPRTALDAFLAQMGKYPVLSNEEERKLTLEYFRTKDMAAGRKLVVHNMRLVVRMAYKYRRAWANILDLIQEGNVGLMEAVKRFDPYKGAKFSTYATFWIRAHMLRFLLENSRTVRISRTRVGRKLFFQLSRERAKLQAMGIDPGPKLLAERLGVDQDELEDVVKHMDQSEVRLDAPLSDDGQGASVLDTMSNQGQSPEAEAFKNEFADAVSGALDSFAQTLTDEREIMAWQKHLMTDDPISLSELGSHFGVTKQRMGQIVNGIRKRLKSHLISELGPDVELGFHFDEHNYS